jgi:hypothetical protein
MTSKPTPLIFLGTTKKKFLFPPHDSFPPPGFPFLSLVLNFRTRFSKFFCLEDELRNVFSEVFDEFELKKFRKTRSDVFVQELNRNIEGVKKSHGGEEHVSN